jgi:hypothetical protein
VVDFSEDLSTIKLPTSEHLITEQSTVENFENLKITESSGIITHIAERKTADEIDIKYFSKSTTQKYSKTTKILKRNDYDDIEEPFIEQKPAFHIFGDNPFTNHPNYKVFSQTPLISLGNSKPKIQKGDEADIAEFPWAVAIFRENSSSGELVYTCAGSLISEYWIVTAAHCLTENGHKL